MDTPFPFGLPSATVFYLVIYVAALALHMVFMNYVLAGTAYLAAVGFLRRRPESSDAIAATLCDWMPFAVGAAITAGVAPLLFVQILYQLPFYTANLLLFHRWMVLLPALIIGFYLTYLIRTQLVQVRHSWLRPFVGIAAFGCFAFTGYSWAENHVLSTDAAAWPVLYVSEAMWYQAASVPARVGVWLFAAFPTMLFLVLCQMHSKSSTGGMNSLGGTDPGAPGLPVDIDPPCGRRAACVALSSLAAAVICAILWYRVAPSVARAAVTSTMALPYLVLAMVGIASQVMAWSWLWRKRTTSRRWFLVGPATLGATLIGLVVVRETVRLAAVDIAALSEKHASAAKVGGLPVFLLFLAVNAALIAWSLRIVWRRRNQGF